MPTIPATALPMVFQVSAALFATPCVALILAYLSLRLRGAPAPTPGLTESVANPDAVLLILDGMQRSLASASGFLGGLGRAFLTFLAVVSTFGLVAAALLWLAGRGLQNGAGWAKPLALTLAVLFTLAGPLVALSTAGLLRAAALALGLGALVLTRSVWSL